MIPVGDVEGMAQYAVEILGNDDVLKKFKANALEQARRFDIEAILPCYEAYYQRVIEKSMAKVV
jgi:hypothetical protein